jgi:hypothetical protein
MQHVLAPLIIALTGLPALAIAWWTGRPGDAHARGTGLRWALIALAMFLGALALYWAGDSRARIYTVTIALVVAVNAMAVSLLRHLRRDGRPGPR